MSYSEDQSHDPNYGGDEDIDDSAERCPDCGAYPEEYHEMDCGYSDDEDIDDEVSDCSSTHHPGCSECAKWRS